MISLLIAAALAADRPVSITAAPPPDAGKARVQVVLDADTATSPDLPGALRAVVGAGKATVTSVRPLAGEPVEVVLAFDQSGSFKKHWDKAFDLAAAWSDALPAGAHARVLLFGVEVADAGDASDAAARRAVLDAARARGPVQGWTRLRSSIRDAIDRASRAAPPDKGGLRQVIVFTDAGEESPAYSVDDVVAWARSNSARVDVVAFVTDSASVARRLDEVKRIAEGTGGRFVQVDDVASATSALQSLATVSERTRWVDLSLCAVPTDRGGTFDDVVEIELWKGGQRAATSGPAPLRQTAVAPATDPCPGTAPVSRLAPAEDPAPPTSRWPWWAPLVVLGTLLPLLLLLLWVVRRRREPDPTPAADPPPSPSPAAEGSSPFAPLDAGGHDPLERLPELHLDRIAGSAGPARVRVNRRVVVVGAGAESDVRLDVPQISTRHATLQLFPNGNVFLRDEGSTNGTFLDGRRLDSGERVKVELGQSIGFSRALTYRLARPDIPPVRGPEPAPARPAKHRTIIAPVQPPPPGDNGREGES